MDLLIAGDVQTILQGKVSANTLHAVSVKALPYALGGAALPMTGALEIGETMIYEGVGHIFTVKASWTETKTLKAAFLMGVERKPQTHFEITQKQSIQNLYQDLIEHYPKGFAIVGKGQFTKLSVGYLKLSPIYEENITVCLHKYWHTEIFKSQEAELFGVVLKQPDQRAFYHNPNEHENISLPSHTHVLIPLARHLLTDSELASGTFWIEAIDTIKSF